MAIVTACPIGRAVSMIGKTEGFFVTFFSRFWLTEESNGGDCRRSPSTDFKALYGYIFL